MKHLKIKLLLTLIAVLVIAANLEASSIDTLVVKSKSMNKKITNIVIVPDSYNENEDEFPVLYLLHGATDYYTSWLEKVPLLVEYVDQYDFIIVCPDGGYTSWYFDSPIDPNMQYESYISEEVVNAIDDKYRTIEHPKGRAISGLSMGGHGAFYLAFRHQDIWGAAGSTSGGLDIRPFPDNWDLAKRLGAYIENKKVWEENTVTNMIHLLKDSNLKLIFDCGVDDFFYDANKSMHLKLLEAKIPHDYTERPGAHNNKYWANSITYQLLFFDDYFN